MANPFLLLIVEADDATRDILTDALVQQYTVYAASDVLEAVDLLQREQFTLLLIDLDLPVLSGSELIQTIRSYPEYDQLPILAIATTLHAFAPLGHHIQATLLKPFGLSELGDVVAATIQTSAKAKSAETRASDKKGRDQSSPTPPWNNARNADGGQLETALLYDWSCDILRRARESQRRAREVIRSIGESQCTQRALIAEARSLVQTGHNLIQARAQFALSIESHSSANSL